MGYKLRAVAIAEGERPWMNVELVKECGIVPYLLHRNHGVDVTIVGAPNEAGYPYLELLEGLKMEFLADGKLATKLKYITENAESIDILILRGINYDSLEVTRAYKSANTKGIIYCGLDINSDYADRIPFYQSPYREFFEAMDVMGASCKKITDFLNDKWYWNVECIRNGYYDVIRKTSRVERVDFDSREKIILYVGRINMDQKASNELVRAFIMASGEIPEWRLRLVGPYTEDFEAFYRKISIENPDLSERIELAGNIDNRNLLHTEYEKAQLFATTSYFEGGTPNALAEALCSGLAMAVTKVDAYEDIIGEDESGMSVDIGDIAGFAEMLIKLCNEADIRQMSENAYRRGNEFFNMENIVSELYDKIAERIATGDAE